MLSLSPLNISVKGLTLLVNYSQFGISADGFDIGYAVGQ
jgi:hypothetical protein